MISRMFVLFLYTIAYDVLYKTLQTYVGFKRKLISENKASFINQLKGFLL